MKGKTELLHRECYAIEYFVCIDKIERETESDSIELKRLDEMTRCFRNKLTTYFFVLSSFSLNFLNTVTSKVYLSFMSYGFYRIYNNNLYCLHLTFVRNRDTSVNKPKNEKEKQKKKSF